MRNGSRAVALILAMLATGNGWADAPLRVLASIKPLQLLALAVGGNEVEVDVLLNPRVSPHDYQLRPSDRTKLDAADVVFWVGPPLEHFLQPALKVLASRVAVIALEDGEADPHLWMDPIAMQVAAQRVAATYASLRPARATVFYANAARLQSALQRADQSVRELLAEARPRTGYIVEHDAYSRFESRYGLSHLVALTDNADLPPSVATMLHIRSLLDSGAAGCVLAEPQESARLRTLINGRAIRVVRLDPMAANVAVKAEGVTGFYRQLGESIVGCLRADGAGGNKDRDPE